MLLIISWKEQMPQNNFEKQLGKLRRNKRALWVGVLFFAAVVMWIAVSLFSAQKKVAISQELRTLATPLIPRLESKVFDELYEQRHFWEEELNSFPIYIFDEEKNKIELNTTVDEEELLEEMKEGEQLDKELEELEEELLEDLNFIETESTDSASN